MPNPGSFSAAEVYDMAVQTERNGYAFYSAAAAAATDKDVRQIMEHLANAEQHHEQVFRKLREAVGDYEAPETYAGEETEYIDSLLRSRVLPDEATAHKLIAEMTADTQALDFALGFEKDTILFLHSMKDVLPPEDQPAIDKLIQQEKMHVRLLEQMKMNRA